LKKRPKKPSKEGKAAGNAVDLGGLTCRQHLKSLGNGKNDIVEVSEEALLPTEHGTFKTRAFMDGMGREHMAVYKGDIAQEKVPVRLHSSCTTGDIFHSLRCDCGPQLAKALKLVEENGCGVVIYLAQEGRGIGLLNKINAYVLQERGLDTVEANERLGFASDSRDYRVASEILRILKVKSIILLTNNPQKIADLECHGTRVAGRMPLRVEPNKYNKRYLHTKKTRMDQML
jgi:3,4-dihydroxy 2-butanone 4-phosphate synthase / GTP cyclohydrolase II